MGLELEQDGTRALLVVLKYILYIDKIPEIRPHCEQFLKTITR